MEPAKLLHSIQSVYIFIGLGPRGPSGLVSIWPMDPCAGLPGPAGGQHRGAAEAVGQRLRLLHPALCGQPFWTIKVRKFGFSSWIWCFNRYSLPFFFNCSPTHVMSCLPSCTSELRPPRYPAISFLQSQGVVQGEWDMILWLYIATQNPGSAMQNLDKYISS